MSFPQARHFPCRLVIPTQARHSRAGSSFPRRRESNTVVEIAKALDLTPAEGVEIAWSYEGTSKDDARQSICQILVEGDSPIRALVEGDRSAFIKFGSAFVRCSLGDRSVLPSFSESIALHRCYLDDSSKTALIIHSNPNQQEVCSLFNMNPSKLPPIKLHNCLDKDGKILKIVYSALSKETVCGNSRPFQKR